jgi:hypothetical protein
MQMWKVCGNWFLLTWQLWVQMKADKINVDKETVWNILSLRFQNKGSFSKDAVLNSVQRPARGEA